MLDYKDVSFSFSDRRRRQRRRYLLWLLLLALAGSVFFGFHCLQARSAVSAIEDLLLAGQLDEAGRRLRHPPSPLLQRGNFRELQALNDLCRGRLPEAAARFAGLRWDGVSTSLRSGRFLTLFFSRGEYGKLDAYAGYLLPRGGDEPRWFHALCRAAFLDAEGAEKAVSGLSAQFRGANAKALELLARFNLSLREGRVLYVFDRNDAPLAYYDLKLRSSRPLVPGIDFSPFDAQFKKGARRFSLTLDAGLQVAIDRLFQGLFGTLVLLELPENAIVAAYSKPRAGKPADAAFSQAYEPGSIVKLVSLLAYLRCDADPPVRNDRDVGTRRAPPAVGAGRGGLFPLQCPGHLAVGGTIIYELQKHGTVRDHSQALARSCNVAFALMGREVGHDALADLLKRFFFKGPDLADQFLSFATGKFDVQAGNELQLARLASGLGGVTMTTLHAAVLASAFAQNGQHFPPYLIDDAKNILNLGFYRHASAPRRLLADDLNFLNVRKAMAAVVEDEKGTGARLRGLAPRLAIKTGTAGNPVGGLDAVLVGFLPVDDPRYAFAFRLEGAGRSDVQGAAFLRRLIQVLYPQ